MNNSRCKNQTGNRWRYLKAEPSHTGHIKKGFYSSRNLIDKILHMILDVEILSICVLLSIEYIAS